MANEVTKMTVIPNLDELFWKTPVKEFQAADRPIPKYRSTYGERTIDTLDCWGEEAVNAIAELKVELGTGELWVSYEQDKVAKTTRVKAEAVEVL